MKINTLIELSDGRQGRTVYHNLDGYGIKWGDDTHDVNDLPEPDAMLRDKYPSAEYECVGEDYTIIN